MAPPRPYLHLTLEQWLEELSRPRPAPAGGSALAYAAATAAALLLKVTRLSGDSWADAAGVAAQASALLARAASLVQADADAYERALAARDASAGLPPERRDWEIGRAYAAAAEPPLEIARLAADIATLAAEVARHADDRLRADTAAAAALAAAAARGAGTIVAANLTAAAGDPRIAES
ncbi:MAG TPA: cyclodeaminase/cyclohydrolase family protein, partial [Gaiellaceae bacterium]|nr:cyclodeaminase/cyclohydrolase family protein [Gaiellaceae bacterium]